MDGIRFQIIPKKKIQWLQYIIFVLIFIVLIPISIYIKTYYADLDLFLFTANVLLFYVLNIFFLNQGWQKLGKTTGLTLGRKSIYNYLMGLSMSGIYKGFEFSISKYSRGYSQNKYDRTKIELELPFNINGSFSVIKKGLLKKNLNLTEIEDFDKYFILKTDLDWVKNRLIQNREIEVGLYDLHKQARKMQLVATTNQLSYQEKGTIKDAEYLMAIMDYLVKMAIIIQQNS